MIEAQLNYFDLAVIGIMALSCLFAFFRGFVKEILSLIAWVGSGFITLHFFKGTAEWLQPHFAKPIVAAAAATLLLYTSSLIGFAIFNRFIIKILRSGSEIGWFDNILGFAFGALRGALIIALGYFMLSMAIPAGHLPDWLAKAVTRPYAEKAAIILAKLAPAYLNELSDMQKKAGGNLQNSMAGDIENSIRKQADDSLHDAENMAGDAVETGKEGQTRFEKLLYDISKDKR